LLAGAGLLFALGCRGAATESAPSAVAAKGDPEEARRAELANASAKAVAAFKAPVITVEQAFAKLYPTAPGGAHPFVVDARQPAEFAVSHLEGATLWDVDAGDPMPETLREAAARGLPILFYCSVGYRSGKAGDLARRAFPKAIVWNMEGGIFAWAEAGHPMEGGPKAHPYDAKWGALLRPDLRAPLDGEDAEEPK
jgi:rhodanese-related sulfurtransferase